MTTAETPLGPIQLAIYNRLLADGTLTALVTGIFDYVPEGTAYPYVVMGEAIETPRNAHGEFGRETVCTLHVWSTYRGFVEAVGVVNRIIELLDHKPLAVSEHSVISVRYEFSQTLRDPNPKLRHVPIRFRVVTEME